MHAWVEIKAPSPSGTSLESFVSEATETVEGVQLTMGFNDTVLTLPKITAERTQEVKRWGRITRDGWIPIDPTAGVCAREIPIFGGSIVRALPYYFLHYGYGIFSWLGYTIHMDEVYPYYPNADRENPTWDNLTITLEPQESFNVSYLHSVELSKIMYNLSSSIASSLPIDFELRNPRMQVVDVAQNVTSYSFNLLIPNWSPNFPKGLGTYWFIVHNPNTEQASVTFGRFEANYITRFVALADAEKELDEILYDEYNNPDLIEVKLDDINAALVSIEGNLATVNSTIGLIQIEISTINAEIASINGTVVTINSNLGQIQVELDAINATLTSIEGRLATIRTDIGTINGTITSIQGDVATIETDVGTIKTLLERWTGGVTSLIIMPEDTFQILVLTTSALEGPIKFSDNIVAIALSGPSGTAGTTNIVVPKQLLIGIKSSIDEVLVTVDDEQVDFVYTEEPEAYVLQTSYTHSTHVIKIFLKGQPPTPFPLYMLVIAIALSVAAVGIALYTIRIRKKA